MWSWVNVMAKKILRTDSKDKPLALRAVPLMLGCGVDDVLHLIRKHFWKSETDPIKKLPVYRLYPDSRYDRVADLDKFIPSTGAKLSLMELIETIPKDWFVFLNDLKEAVATWDERNPFRGAKPIDLDPTVHGFEELIKKCPSELCSTISTVHTSKKKTLTNDGPKEKHDERKDRWMEEAVSLYKGDDSLTLKQISERIAGREYVRAGTIQRILSMTAIRKKARLS